MAVFPGALFTAPTLGALMSTAPTHSTVHNNANGEIAAIEAALGINPQGSFATVKAWLTALQASAVRVFGSEALRDAAGTPTEGMVAYASDVNSLTFYDGAAWRYLMKAPAAWTPAGLGAANLTSATFATFYSIKDNEVHAWGGITLGASSAVGTGTFQTSLPVNANTSGMKLGTAFFYDTSAAAGYVARAELGSSTTLSIIRADTAGIGGGVTATTPFTWASGDQIVFDIRYEAA